MRNRYTKELLEPIIQRCINWSQVCREIGIAPMTGAQTHVKKRAKDFDIDFSHFLGCASNRGKVFGPKLPLSIYLSNKKYINSHSLKLRLFSEGIKKRQCEKCKRQKWCGDFIPLELDHKNNNHFDNRIENLAILCPNCHAIKTNIARKKYTSVA